MVVVSSPCGGGGVGVGGCSGFLLVIGKRSSSGDGGDVTGMICDFDSGGGVNGDIGLMTLVVVVVMSCW